MAADGLAPIWRQAICSHHEYVCSLYISKVLHRNVPKRTCHFFIQTMYIQWYRADHVYYMVLWLGARQPAVRSIWPSSLWGRSDPNRVIYEAGLKCQSECEKSRASLPQSAGHAIPQYRRDSRGIWALLSMIFDCVNPWSHGGVNQPMTDPIIERLLALS